MNSLNSVWRKITRQKSEEDQESTSSRVEALQQATMLDVEIAQNDPLLIYFQNSPGVVDIESLLISSPGLAALKEAGVRLVVPLVSQGELIGLINLGPRLSEQEYSADDRKLLNDLATQAAPAVRVAQLARQQQAEARERERMEQELRIASLIQQTLLPKDVPQLESYEVAAYYQPAREVGGDFYDFIYFDDGRVGIIVGDVTDKGVPAALVMATTRTLLRAAVERLEKPGAVLERVNELLFPDIPQRMFVTCLYALLDPDSGQLQYANAGHDLPYRRYENGVDELKARGMPLGLMQGMFYEEKALTLEPGQTVLFHSDGLVEAHSQTGEMFGFPKLQSLMADHEGGAELVDFLLDELAAFTGPDWIQEDDVTLVTLQRTGESLNAEQGESRGERQETIMEDVANFSIASEPGNERQAMEKVAQIAEEMNLSDGRLEKLKTAVAEATMNAMEHGNKYQADLPVQIEVLSSDAAVLVRITDQGGGEPIAESQTPDLEAKLTGQQSPRGWGLFLIQNMVDEMNIISNESHHTIELKMNLEAGDEDGNATEGI
jgi:serine phosphatase RsbU (regulator of sigma subunit)/anti-sigma regulatory factor (Ser/Thr protein kinase)